MNKLYLLFGIVFLLSIGYAEAVCSTWTNNTLYSISTSNETCTGSYYNVTFSRTGSNNYLNCSGTCIFIGAGSGNFYATGGSSSQNISGLTITNYTSIIAGGGQGHRIYNNYFGYATKDIDNTGSNLTIYNNVFNNTKSTGIGIDISASGTNYTVYGNIFYEANNSIKPNSNSNYWNIYDNIIICQSDDTAGILLGGINHNIYNNNITGCIYGISHEIFPYNDSKGFSNIYNNLLIGQSHSGIKFEGGSSERIYNNTVLNQSNYGIFSNRINNSEIFSNLIMNTVSNSLRNTGEYSNYNYIHDNNIFNCGWSCLDVMGSYSNFSNNYLNNCSHVGLNAPDDYNSGTYHSMAYNLVYNNYVNNSGSCMYIDGSIYSNFTNNTCIINHLYSNVNNSLGISTDGHYNITTGDISHYGNVWTNNIINGADEYALQDNTENSSDLYKDNIIIDSNNTAYAERNYKGTLGVLTVSFINNSKDNSKAIYDFDVNDPQIINIIDYSLNITLNLNTNRKVSFFGSTTLKNFTINNQTVSIYNLSYPYNDIKNTSNGVILASNVDNISITLVANQQIEVGDFTGGQCSIGTNTRTGLLCIIGGCN